MSDGMKRILAVAGFATVFAALFASESSAATGLVGSQVAVAVNYPALGDVLATAGPVTVGSGVEFPSRSILPGRDIELDIANSTITFLPNEFTTYGAASFNGFVLTFTGAPTITGVTYDAGLSTFAPTNISFTGDSVALNFAGAVARPSYLSTVDVSFASVAAAPEPATWALMLVGFAGLGFVGCRGRRKAIAA